MCIGIIASHKHLAAVLLAFFAVSFVSFADTSSQTSQQTHSQETAQPQYMNSIDIGYNPGELSILKLVVFSKVKRLEPLLPIASLLLGVEVDGLRSSGTFSFNLMHRANDWLWFGFDVGFESVSLDLRNREDEISSVKVNGVPVMAMGKAVWLSRPNVALYSKLGLGVTNVFMSGKYKQISAAFQLTPFGAEFGGDHVLGFVECGLGLQGVMMAGVRFPF